MWKGIVKDQTWVASGKVMEFDGFLKLWDEVDEDVILPLLEKGDQFPSKEIVTKQNFTKPPARYTEATLVKTLEQKGIGRPSTYASTISTIQDRWYVVKEDNKLKPSEIAFNVTDFLEQHFNQLMDYEFTAGMEDQLDEVANGEVAWKKMLSNFYEGFEKQLVEAQGWERVKLSTGKICPKCWKWELLMKYGKDQYGFLWCENYPECDYTAETDIVTEKLAGIREKFEGKPCPAGWTIVVRIGRFGPFLSSSLYPQVKWIKSPGAYQVELDTWDNKPVCPNCGSEMVLRWSKRGSYFWGCSKYPDCNGIVNLAK